MPLTPKGEKIKSAMQEQYGSEKGERVFYASRNKGTITGVDSTTVTHSRAIPGLGRTTVTHTNDMTNTVDSWFRDNKGTRDGDGDKGGPLVTGPLPVPERQKDLLGEVSEPESTPRGPLKSAAAPESNKKSGDAKAKAKDQSSTSGMPSMNNLGMGIPAPNISGHPGTSTSTSTGDSLRAMNSANRAFWARKR